MGLKFESNRAACAVYSITNTINGKVYVGCSKDINKRMAVHRYASKKQAGLFYQDIRDYGGENFEVKILEECLIIDRHNREKYWIKKMNSKYPNGYNLTDGGIGVPGRAPSKKSIAVLVKRNKERVVTQKERDTNSAKIKKRWENPTYRENHSNKMKEYYKHNNAANTRRVNMIDKNTEEILLCFRTLTNAVSIFRGKSENGMYNPSSIRTVCKGRRPTAYGYKWQYNNEGNEQNGK